MTGITDRAVADLMGEGSKRLSLERIAAAAEVIGPEFRDSPQFEAPAIGRMFAGRLVVKIETLNPIRSFKTRGAQFLMSQLSGRPHIVCATAGNFGMGMAYAARERGFPITVFIASSANPVRVERMQALGAEVRIAGETSAETQRAAEVFATETAAMLIEDGRHPAIAEGAGTIGREMLRRRDAFHSILVPLGDGALLGGVACWVKAHSPQTRMIGICAAKSPAMERSWRSGERTTWSDAGTIACGLSAESPHAESVDILRETVDDILLVEDETLIAAMRLAHSELGVVLEPSGAAGLAALLAHGDRFRGETVGTILTGGNLSEDEIRRWLG